MYDVGFAYFLELVT